MISKLFWATWHRDLGKLAMDVMGPEAELAAGEPYDLKGLQRMFLFTRSDTIYAGSNQIQRNIISRARARLAARAALGRVRRSPERPPADSIPAFLLHPSLSSTHDGDPARSVLVIDRSDRENQCPSCPRPTTSPRTTS